MRPHWVREHYRENAPYVRGYIRGCGKNLAAKRSYFHNTRAGKQYTSDWTSARGTMPPEERWRCALSKENADKCAALDGIYHVTPGGSCIAVASDGDVIAHAPNSNDPMSAREHITLAIECGGEKIDGYDGLFETYRLAGFVPVAWCKFDPAFAADGWDPSYGEEDLIFFVAESLCGELDDDVDDLERWKKNHPPAPSYEEAKRRRDDAHALMKKRIEFNNTPDAKTYLANLGNAKESCDKEDAWRVYKPSTEEFLEEHPGALLYTSPGGSCIAVCDDGDIVGVCHMVGDEIRGKELIEKAVEVGGTKLDSYDGNHVFYLKCGFVPVSWCHWDERFAPDDWDPSYGTEDIVFYVLSKYTNEKKAVTMDIKEWKRTHPASKDYVAATRARDKVLEQATRVR